MAPPPISNNRTISSYFTPKKEEAPRKIVVKDILKSKNGAPVTFTPPKDKPFSLTQRTTSLTRDLAQFRLRDNGSPNSSNNNSEEEEEKSDRVLRKRKPAKLAVAIELDSDDDDTTAGSENEVEQERVVKEDEEMKDVKIIDSEDEDDDEIIQVQIKKRKRKIALSDDEEEEDDDDDDDDDVAYVDEREKKEGQSMSYAEKMERLQSLYYDKSYEELRAVLDACGGLLTKAISVLAQDDGITPSSRISSPSSSSVNRRLKKRKSRNKYDTSSEEEDDDEDEVRKDIRKAHEAEQTIREDRKALNFFNTATSQDIQDVTGCRPEAAEKIINQLRPFTSIDDLEVRLKAAKGVSQNYISAYKNLQKGYSATDRIIERIERVGNQLQGILNVWKGEAESAASSRQGSPSAGDDGEVDEKAGTHITSLCKDNNNSSIDKNSRVYRDAMDGYLTTQPKYVNPEMTLKDYQIMGVNWMLLLYRKGISGILADEMGLGKTAQVISFLARLYEIGESGPHLIIVPSSTLENWVREFGRFAPELQVRTYHGSQSERFELRMELLDTIDDYQVVVTTYNVAASNKDDRSFLKQLGCSTMILDEGHMVKNCFSSRYQQLMKVKTPFRLLLTGTPLQNSLQELISLLTFIMPETFTEFGEELKSVFQVKTNMADVSGKKNNYTESQVLSRNRIHRAKQLMTPFVLRRRKMDVLKDLPQKFHVNEYCTMTEGQQKLYNKIVKESKKTFEETPEETAARKLARKNTDMSSQYASLSNIVIHLRKAADHPLLFRNLYDDAKIKIMAKEIMKDVRYWDSEEQYIYEDMSVMSDFELHNLCNEHKVIKHHALKTKSFMDSGKVDKLCELLKKYKNSKVLIFSQFTKMLDILEVVLAAINVSYLRLDGETKVMERQSIIDQFNEDEDHNIPVFLLSTKAGGFGINLTSANIVILFDMDFNPQNDKQAEDRAHRVGQTKDVTVIRLISKNSVEEYILKLADLKLRLDKHISANGEEEDNLEDTENEKKNLREILKNEFKSVE